MRDIDDNARARAIVISSTGKHFTAGMDLAAYSTSDLLSGRGAGDRYVRVMPSGQVDWSDESL